MTPRHPSPWTGMVAAGMCLVALGILIACLTYTPVSGSIATAAWALVTTGAALTAIGIGNLQ